MAHGVFVDTSALVACAVEKDDRHAEAAAELLRLLDAGSRLVTSTDVFDETVTRVRGRAGHRAAVTVGEQLRHSHDIRLVAVTEPHRHAAWGLFVRYADQEFSLTDCSSMVLAKANGIREVFTFDRGFARVGFTILPRPT